MSFMAIIIGMVLRLPVPTFGLSERPRTCADQRYDNSKSAVFLDYMSTQPPLRVK